MSSSPFLCGLISGIVVTLLVLTPLASSHPVQSDAAVGEKSGANVGRRQGVRGTPAHADAQGSTQNARPQAQLALGMEAAAARADRRTAKPAHQQDAAGPGVVNVPLVQQPYTAQAPAVKGVAQPASDITVRPSLATARPEALPAAAAPVLGRQAGAMPLPHPAGSSAGSSNEEEGFGHWQPSGGAPSMGATLVGGAAGTANGRPGPGAAQQALFSSGSSAVLGRRGGEHVQGTLFLGGKAAEDRGEVGCGLFAMCSQGQQGRPGSLPSPAGASAEPVPGVANASAGGGREEGELVTVTVVVQQRPAPPRDLIKLLLEGAAGMLQPGKQQ